MVRDKPCLQAEAVVVQEGMMGPGDGRARGQQDKRVEERQMPGIERFDALGRPMPPVNSALEN